MLNSGNAINTSKLYQTSSTQLRRIIYVIGAKNSKGTKYEGWLKIGMTSEPTPAQYYKDNGKKEDNTPNSPFLRQYVNDRVIKYMGTSWLPYNIYLAQLAYNENSNTFFTDKDVHKLLNRSGYHHTHGVNGTKAGEEWYKISLNGAIKAIEAVKGGKTAISKEPSNPLPIHFRPEQKSIIKKTVKLFKSKSKDNNKMLWNAKMRFGKTLCALRVGQRIKATHVLIITHRPDVDKEWHSDFVKLFRKTSRYAYGSKNYGEKSLNMLNNSGKRYFYFASLQDLLGSKYSGVGDYDKDRNIFNNHWNLLIIDEAHEGTLTPKAQKVLNRLHFDKSLALSGTPFNLLASKEYRADQICTWNYTDEQEAKANWNNLELGHINANNPYNSLPKMTIFAFHLKSGFSEFVNDKNGYFNFSKFFAVDPKTHDFIYKDKIEKFLRVTTNPNNSNHFPYSNMKYINRIPHTLWVMPSVASANALEPMLKNDPVFGGFHIVNVVKDDDDISKNRDAQDEVENAIHNHERTITLTVRKLTLGVTIPQWTAVVFLSDTRSTAQYLQTAFRCQSPYKSKYLDKNKTNCYVFDFSPERVLEMYANVASLNPSHNSTEISQKDDETTELKSQCRFMPIISVKGNSMTEYNVDRVVKALEKSFADKAVQNGFDCNDLYDDNALMHLTEDDLALLDKVHRQEKDSKRHGKTVVLNPNDVPTAKHGRRKPKRKQTPKEKHAINKVEQAERNRKWAINVLRPVSLRIPLMIYGMRTSFNEHTKASNFTKEVDNESWRDFMPKGIKKDTFNACLKFYDVGVFISAGEDIQAKVKAIDKEEPLKRATDIADIFSHFQNPDNQSVLTPWQTINQHIGRIFGGLSNFDNTFNRKVHPHMLSNTNLNVFYPNTHVLEMCSRTGLYSLYIVSTLYYQALMSRVHHNLNITTDDKWQLWYQILNSNIYIIANTPMARDIIIRTLVGYNSFKPRNIRCKEDFVNEIDNDNPNKTVSKADNSHQTFIQQAKDNPNKTVFEIEKGIRGFQTMKFDVVIGNPPYAKNDNKKGNSASPIYQHFVNLAEHLSNRYVSLIIPTKWYVAGKGLEKFRKHMLDDVHMRELLDFMTPESVFPNTHIRGGVTIFLWDKKYDNSTTKKGGKGVKNVRVINIKGPHGKVVGDTRRPLKIGTLNYFFRDIRVISIMKKIPLDLDLIKHGDSKKAIAEIEKKDHSVVNVISPRGAFGISTKFKYSRDFHENPKDLKKLKDPVKVYASKGSRGYVERKLIPKHQEWIDRDKFYMSRSNNIGTADMKDDNLNVIKATSPSICTDSYLVFGAQLNNSTSVKNLAKYLNTKFARFLNSLNKVSIDASRKVYRYIPMQDFKNNNDIDWDKPLDDIDQQLFDKYGLTQEEQHLIRHSIKENTND